MSAPNLNPLHFNFTRDVVDYWSQAGGDPVAMVWNPPNATDPEQVLPLRFSHFSQRANKVAHGLRRLGLQKGDVVLLLSSKTPDWYEVLCGAFRAGVVVSLCPAVLTESEIALRIRKSGASGFVGEAESIQKMVAIKQAGTVSTSPSMVQIGESTGDSQDAVAYKSLLEMGSNATEDFAYESESSDACLLYFTSGTGGEPKVVKHDHVSYPYGKHVSNSVAVQIADLVQAHGSTGKNWLQLSPGKLLWNLSDQGWAKATWAVFGAWNQGAALFIDAQSGPIDPNRVIDILAEQEINTLCAAPAIFRMLVMDESKQAFAEKPPRSLEHSTSAGESLPTYINLAWYEITDGVMTANGYGQSETSILCGNYEPVPFRQGSMGKPLPEVPLFILNDDRYPVAADEEGEIAVLLPNEGENPSFWGVFQGYVNEDGSVAVPVVTNKDGQRWYLTGDRAWLDEDGYYWYKGRADDVIITAGHRVGPVEVESVLQTHPAIRESAVIAAEDGHRGTIIKAIVVLEKGNEGATEDEKTNQLKQEIREHCLQHKGAQYCPQKIEFVAHGFLPRTVSGKIIRKALRIREAEMA